MLILQHPVVGFTLLVFTRLVVITNLFAVADLVTSSNCQARDEGSALIVPLEDGTSIAVVLKATEHRFQRLLLALVILCEHEDVELLVQFHLLAHRTGPMNLLHL